MGGAAQLKSALAKLVAAKDRTTLRWSDPSSRAPAIAPHSIIQRQCMTIEQLAEAMELARLACEHA